MCLCLYLVDVVLGIPYVGQIVKDCIGAKDYLVVTLIDVDVTGTGLFHHLVHVWLPSVARKVYVAVKTGVRQLVGSCFDIIFKESQVDVETVHVVTLVCLAKQ